MNENKIEILNIQNLNISTFSNSILKDVSLKIYKGEMIGLVGESGSGKSVTALSILSLLDEKAMKIDTGKIFLSNENILEKKEVEMQKIRGNKISMIFQEPMTSLNPVFTIGDQINEVHNIHTNLSKNEANELTINLLDKVGIPNPEISVMKYPHQLSGGQRQRVMIAMALSCKPKLLIADEPTTALDVIVQAQILKIINDLRKELEMSVLLITHDLGVVQDYCDRVYVMYKGRIVENSKAKDLFSNPAHPYTKDLLNTRPAVNPPGKELPIIKENYSLDA
ncbi:MAG: ABC transporter ATP-binding protein [Alphaproteobacteria bacterium]|nr:ABC transporter ATP-binding protein [Alphaproteobacteria bacterium]